MKVLLPSIILTAAGINAAAVPSTRPPLPSYIVKTNTTFVPFSSGPIDRRQAGATDCEVGGAVVVAQDLNAAPGESPQAFTQLFDWLQNSACTQLGCGGEQYCVTASTGADVCIEVSGSFAREQRNDFLRSARGAFTRTITRQEPGQGVIETGTNLVNIRGVSGPYGTGFVRVDLRNQDSGGGGGCPAIIQTIANGGSLIPQIAAPFGVVSFLCDTASFQGQATG